MTSIALITLSAPWMLAGIGLLTLPVVAHLMNRRSHRRVTFPTLDFLTAAAAAQSRLFRLRRLMLLLLRCMAACFIVLAFAGPLWVARGAPSVSEGRASGLVVIVDTSASAGRVEDGVSLMQSMRAAVSRTLASEAADLANVIEAGALPHAMHPVMTRSIETLRSDVATLEAGQGRADISAAIGLAGQMLASVNGERGVVIVSDMQATNWPDVQGLAASAAALPTGTRVKVVPVGESTTANVSVTVASITPSRPVVGASVRVVARVINQGALERRLPVTLEIDGRSHEEKALRLDGWQRGELVFDFVADRFGERAISVTVPDDVLTADNRGYGVVHTARHATVVVVSDEPAGVRGTASYFVERALSPRGEGGLAVRRVASSAVDGNVLRDASVAVVTGAGAMNRMSAERLYAFMQSGGGVVFFCDTAESAANAKLLDEVAQTPGGILPFTLTTRRQDAPTAATRIGDVDWSGTFLRGFDAVGRRQIGRLKFWRTWEAQGIRQGADPWMKFTDARPALARRAVGEGVCVMANFGVGQDDSDWARHGSFVVLMHGMIGQLERRWTGNDATVGTAVTIAVQGDGGQGLRVISPTDEDLREIVMRGAAGQQSVTIPATPSAGIYRAVLSDGTIAGMSAVNLDEREGDLRSVEPVALERAMTDAGAAAVEFMEASSGMGDHGLMLHGKPLWGWALVGAIGFFAAEMLIQWRWSR